MTEKFSRNDFGMLLLLVALLGLSGSAAPPHVQTLVPVPVECRETLPVRPVMPSEVLLPGVAPWMLLRDALSEIDRREGYELQLRAALISCLSPR